MGLLARLFQERGGPMMARLARAAGEALPMDEASRMARAKAMGFDVETPLYHGTAGDEVVAFDPSRKGLINHHTRSGPGATFLTDNPELASQYAELAARLTGGAPAVYPVFARGRFDPAPRPYMENSLKAAKDRGRAGIVSYLDDSPLSAEDPTRAAWSTVYSVLNPANIRSRFAAFDPERSGSSDLLASTLLSLGLGGGLISRALQDRQA